MVGVPREGRIDMQLGYRHFRLTRQTLLIASAILTALSFAWVGHVYADGDKNARNGRLVTVHDRGEEKVVLTHAKNVRDALKDAGIAVEAEDSVEPRLDSELIATDYVVNIYRARPVIVVDGSTRQKIMTAAQTPRAIVDAADVTDLRDEDKATLQTSGDLAADGASLILAIDRATPFTLQLYGKPVKTYSHADTVGEMLEQKGVKLSATDKLSVSQDTPLSADMTVAIWREGIQTATIDEPIAFTTRMVLDADHPVGYRKVQAPGEPGRKSVTYDITAKNGQEISRKIIQSVTLEKPKEQIVLVGNKPKNPLTSGKGAQYFTDSKGVSHRETYYDLPMNVVMNACGGGAYSVRADGAKVDRDGYILIAAHLGNYPRCSIVETSMGLGKVYDTGGFAAKHPHGFDLATDWSNRDGR